MEKKLCINGEEYIEFIRTSTGLEESASIEDLERLIGIEWGITLRGKTYYPSMYSSLSHSLLEEVESLPVDFSTYRVADEEAWPCAFPVTAILSTISFEGRIYNDICLVYLEDFKG